MDLIYWLTKKYKPGIVFAIGIALLTVSFQAIRAATANPTVTLRTGE
jgi:hypothetical protein